MDTMISRTSTMKRYNSGKGMIMHQSRKGMSIMGYRSKSVTKADQQLNEIADSCNSDDDSDVYSEVDEVDMNEMEDALLFSAVSLARNEEENQIERFSRASNSQWSMLVLLEPI